MAFRFGSIQLDGQLAVSSKELLAIEPAHLRYGPRILKRIIGYRARASSIHRILNKTIRYRARASSKEQFSLEPAHPQ
jgi:hypothetical protein